MKRPPIEEIRSRREPDFDGWTYDDVWDSARRDIPALLAYIDSLERVVEATRKACDCRVFVKNPCPPCREIARHDAEGE